MCCRCCLTVQTEEYQVIGIKFHVSDLTVLDVHPGEFVSQMRPVFEMIQNLQESEQAAGLEQAKVNESVIDLCVWGTLELSATVIGIGHCAHEN